MFSISVRATLLTLGLASALAWAGPDDRVRMSRNWLSSRIQGNNPTSYKTSLLWRTYYHLVEKEEPEDLKLVIAEAMENPHPVVAGTAAIIYSKLTWDFSQPFAAARRQPAIYAHLMRAGEEKFSTFDRFVYKFPERSFVPYAQQALEESKDDWVQLAAIAYLAKYPGTPPALREKLEGAAERVVMRVLEKAASLRDSPSDIEFQPLHDLFHVPLSDTAIARVFDCFNADGNILAFGILSTHLARKPEAENLLVKNLRKASGNPDLIRSYASLVNCLPMRFSNALSVITFSPDIEEMLAQQQKRTSREIFFAPIQRVAATPEMLARMTEMAAGISSGDAELRLNDLLYVLRQMGQRSRLSEAELDWICAAYLAEDIDPNFRGHLGELLNKAGLNSLMKQLDTSSDPKQKLKTMLQMSRTIRRASSSPGVTVGRRRTAAWTKMIEHLTQPNSKIPFTPLMELPKSHVADLVSRIADLPQPRRHELAETLFMLSYDSVWEQWVQDILIDPTLDEVPEGSIGAIRFAKSNRNRKSAIAGAGLSSSPRLFAELLTFGGVLDREIREAAIQRAAQWLAHDPVRAHSERVRQILHDALNSDNKSEGFAAIRLLLIAFADEPETWKLALSRLQRQQLATQLWPVLAEAVRAALREPGAMLSFSAAEREALLDHIQGIREQRPRVLVLDALLPDLELRLREPTAQPDPCPADLAKRANKPSDETPPDNVSSP